MSAERLANRTCGSCSEALPTSPAPDLSAWAGLPPTLDAEGAFSPSARADDVPTREADFGAYELLAPIAEGGMGVVYKARHRALCRVVALKMVRSGKASTALDLSRFRREAETAAALAHPAIVPIYEVGEVAGQPFYAMQLIDGCRLDEHLERLGWDARVAARLLAEVARAVHHAHQRGVLHRDLKPANVLVDRAGQPHVTDFGLAKRLLGPDGAGTQLTQTGAIVGTPSFMAPEQASPPAGGLTMAVDVYGLGAVLYAVLTGRPPFQGATAFDTLVQVCEQPPCRPRALRRGLSRDLEAICLKCLEKAPEKRYSSAQALADDLERWLANEPTQARPPGRARRVLKWAWRRPAAAALVLVTVLAVLALGGGGWWSQARLQAALGRASAGEEEARRERAPAKANFVRARDTIDRMVDRLDREELPFVPAVEQVRQAVLFDALELYKAFLEEKSSDPEVRGRSARAYRRVGDLYRSLGQPERARLAYDRALALLQALAEERSGDQHELAETLSQRGRLRQALGHFDEAEEDYRQALGRRREMLERAPEQARARQELAQAQTALGALLHETGRTREATESLRAAQALCAQLTDDFPESAGHHLALARAANELGKLLAETRRPREAEKAYRLAVERGAQLTAYFPDAGEHRLELARSQRNLGALLAARPASRERLAEGEKTVRTALAGCAKLAQDFPMAPEYRQELARCQTELALIQGKAPDGRASARAAHAEALRLRAQLAADSPTVPGYRQELARSHRSLAELARASGQADEAERALQAALRLQRELVAAHPRVAAYRCDLGNSLTFDGVELLRQGRPAQAREQLEQATEQHLAALRTNWRQPLYRRALVRSETGLGDVLVRAKDHVALALAADRHLAVWTGPEGKFHGARLLARAAGVAGNGPQAEAYARRAVELLGQAVQHGLVAQGGLKSDRYLAPLRERADFRAVLAGPAS